MPNYVAVLEPTSPGRRAFHIDEAIQILRERKVDSVASVSGVPHHYVPEKVLLMDKDGHLSGLQGSHPDHMIHLRQLASRYFAFDGIFFGCRAELPLADEPTLWGENVVGYEVEPKYVMDIDTQDDWDLAEVKFKWIQRGG